MWKPFKSYNEQARHILELNRYMVIASCDRSMKPWAAPVFYAYDESYNFYFVSAIDSQHVKNIMENPEVALDIFDSRQQLGYSEQVQIYGSVSEIGKDEIDRVIKLYCERLYAKSGTPNSKNYYDPKSYVPPSEFRFFKVKVIKAYTMGTDRRVEIDLGG